MTRDQENRAYAKEKAERLVRKTEQAHAVIRRHERTFYEAVPYAEACTQNVLTFWVVQPDAPQETEYPRGKALGQAKPEAKKTSTADDIDQVERPRAEEREYYESDGPHVIERKEKTTAGNWRTSYQGATCEWFRSTQDLDDLSPFPSAVRAKTWLAAANRQRSQADLDLYLVVPLAEARRAQADAEHLERETEDEEAEAERAEREKQIAANDEAEYTQAHPYAKYWHLTDKHGTIFDTVEAESLQDAQAEGTRRHPKRSFIGISPDTDNARSKEAIEELDQAEADEARAAARRDDAAADPETADPWIHTGSQTSPGSGIEINDACSSAEYVIQRQEKQLDGTWRRYYQGSTDSSSISTRRPEELTPFPTKDAAEKRLAEHNAQRSLYGPDIYFVISLDSARERYAEDDAQERADEAEYTQAEADKAEAAETARMIAKVDAQPVEAQPKHEYDPVRWLVTCPSGDTNFHGALKSATIEQLREALERVRGGRGKKTATAQIERQIQKMEPAQAEASQPRPRPKPEDLERHLPADGAEEDAAETFPGNTPKTPGPRVRIPVKKMSITPTLQEWTVLNKSGMPCDLIEATTIEEAERYAETMHPDLCSTTQDGREIPPRVVKRQSYHEKLMKPA